MRLGFVEPPYLLAVGVVLLATFLSVGGDLGVRAPVLLIGLVWTLHLCVGLVSIRVFVISLSRWGLTARWSDMALLLVAGLLASFVLAPLSFAIDQGLLRLDIDTDDELIAGTRWWGLAILFGIFEEWTHVAAPTLLVAVMLGLPAWWARRQAVEPLDTPTDINPTTVNPADIQRSNPGSCLQRLPQALGTELVAARSELQYLRIYTTIGDALILGALKDVEEHQAPDGQLVHRSWWVSNSHIRALRRRGNRYILTLSNGLEVPVSRRRQPALIRQFGVSANLH